MTGGYLTLDFSDVEFKEGNDLSTFQLGYRKGIFNYIQKTTKPIYIVLSASVMNAIQNYIKSPEQRPQIITSKCVILLNPIFNLDDNLNTARLFILLDTFYEAQQISCIYSPSLRIQFNDDDSITFVEI